METSKDKLKFKTSNIAMLFTHGLNEIVSIFVGTFLISYIYSLSNNYILDIGLFYFSQYASMFVFYTIISKLIDKTDRVTFYRISLFVKGVFILCVVLVGKDLAKIATLAGLLYGFAEACYWSSYNLMKNELVTRHAMEKYSLFQFIDSRAIKIIIPLILGKIIDGESFKVCAIIVLVSVVVQTIISLFIKSKRPENSSFNFKEFIQKTKALPTEKSKLVWFSLFVGLCYGFGCVVSPINTILIMISFGTNFSLGVLSSIFAVFSMILLLVCKKWTKLGRRGVIYLIMACLPLVALILLLVDVNKTTVVIFSLIHTIAVILYEFGFDVMRNLLPKKLDMYDSIAEYQCAIEGSLQVGRIIIFTIMISFGLITAGFNPAALGVSVKIFSALSILIVSLMNILLLCYEKKFRKQLDA